MAETKLQKQEMQEAHFAIARSNNLPISKKESYEICNFIRGRNISIAKRLLQQVIDKKTAVPYKRYNDSVGHKPGIASGRYPEKASKYFLTLLNTAEANADQKGLDSEKLVIKEIMSTSGSHQFHPGRIRGRRMKRTHLYVKVEESEK